MKNREIADQFYTIADFLELDNDNPFRIRAYRRGADAILSFPGPVEKLSRDELTRISGVGNEIAAKIREAVTLGEISLLRDLREKIPEELLSMKKIPGLGPKKVALFYRDLGVRSIDELKRAMERGDLLTLPGIKTKTVENILKGIEFYEKARERIALGDAYALSTLVIEDLREKGAKGSIMRAGSLRRGKESVGDIDILVAGEEGCDPVSILADFEGVTDVLARGATKGSVRVDRRIQVDLRVVDRESFGSALQYFTGSKTHNVKIRHLAKKSGFSLSEYGRKMEGDNAILPIEREEELYGLLGMEYIPPELREDRGEVEAAREGGLPRLIDPGMIRGELHLHTDWSDGYHTLEDVAEIMRKRGFSYFAVTDHSKSLRVAGGLDEEGVEKQRKAIAQLNESFPGITILSGIEVDILKDGTLDLKRSVLRNLDFVTASIHSGFSQSREEATGRILAAMDSGCVDMIGHLTGRLIGERRGYDVDLEPILARAGELDVVLEVNSHPKRLDINDLTCRMAKERGVKVAITTDMHHVEDLDTLHFGITVAKRGWLEEDDVINTWELDRLLRFLKKRREKHFTHK